MPVTFQSSYEEFTHIMTTIKKLIRGNEPVSHDLLDPQRVYSELSEEDKEDDEERDHDSWTIGYESRRGIRASAWKSMLRTGSEIALLIAFTVIATLLVQERRRPSGNRPETLLKSPIPESRSFPC